MRLKKISVRQAALAILLTSLVSLLIPHVQARIPGPEARAVELADKVQSMLDFAYGQGAAHVEVTVDVDRSVQSFLSSTNEGAPEHVTHETVLEESCSGSHAEANPQTASSDEEASLPQSAGNGSYRNVKRNVTHEPNRTQIVTTHCDPRVTAVHCVVVLRAPAREQERAERMVRALLGCNERRGDTAVVSCF